jgi:DNA repair protein RecO (recombination protein O)
VSEILSTPAIVLRWHEVTNTSRIVQWLTPAHGRIATLIKGSQRPRSAFLGQYDLYQTCELLFYARDRDGLHIARECAPLRPRPELRRRWRAALAASHAAALVLGALPRHAPVPEVQAWLDALLDDLSAHDHHPAVLAWFELHLLDRLGVAPRLETCAVCGGAVEGGGALRFSAARGGVLHAPCAAAEADAAAVLSPGVLALLRACRRAQHPAQVRTIQTQAGQRREMHRLLGRFCAHHLELDPLPRELALDLWERPSPLAEAS